jgi:hypothetical protein
MLGDVVGMRMADKDPFWPSLRLVRIQPQTELSQMGTSSYKFDPQQGRGHDVLSANLFSGGFEDFAFALGQRVDAVSGNLIENWIDLFADKFLGGGNSLGLGTAPGPASPSCIAAGFEFALRLSERTPTGKFFR